MELNGVVVTALRGLSSSFCLLPMKLEQFVQLKFIWSRKFKSDIELPWLIFMKLLAKWDPLAAFKCKSLLAMLGLAMFPLPKMCVHLMLIND